MIKYSIYKITNKITQKVYIGSTNSGHKRIWKHIASCRKGLKTKLCKDVEIYGWDNFDFEIIYESLDREHCINVMEKKFIEEYNSILNGYNFQKGGQKNRNHFTFNLSQDDFEKLGKMLNLNLEGVI